MPATKAGELQAIGQAMLEARMQGSPLRQDSPMKFDLQPTQDFEMIHERHMALVQQLERQRDTIEQLEAENRSLKSTNATLQQNVVSGSQPAAVQLASGTEATGINANEDMASLRETLEQVRQNVQASSTVCHYCPRER